KSFHSFAPAFRARKAKNIMEEKDTREKILKGAEVLFTRYGVRSISMDDIARHLSVSKKTLYQHFADKDELVTMVSKSHMHADRMEYEQITKNAENAIDELHKIAICLKRDMEEMNPTLLHDIQKFHPKAWAIWESYKSEYIYNSVVRNIKQGIEDGHFRADINPHILAAKRLGVIEMCFDERVFPSSKFNLAEVQTQVFEHFVYGLTTEKGKKLYLKYK
ncbi:MAG: TetR/AcrR family transcriptional regulator, partial [Cytophagales bacterium]